MTQKYILDTSAILTDPHCIDSFPNSNVIIQIDVLNELDKIKSSPSTAGKNARVIVRILDDLTRDRDITAGIKRPNGSTIYLDSNIYDSSRFGDPSYTDNKILACADASEGDTTIVSNDLNLRIRARIIGVKAEACKKEKHSIDELHRGFSTVINSKLGEQLKKDKYIKCISDELQAIKPNECIVFKNRNGKTVSIGRKIDDEICFIKNSRAWGLGSKNIEQAFAMDMLLDPDVNLVSLAGIAGSGKAQPLNAKILTPTGYVTMGSIKPGDIITSANGKTQKITAIHPQGKKDIYKVYFSDNSSTECCDDHLWMTKTCINRWNHQSGDVKTLKEIRKTLRYGKSQKRNHSIPMVKPIEFQSRNVPVAPYLLGCLLGDGALSIDNRVGFSTKDTEILDICTKMLPDNLRFVKCAGDNYDYRISKGHMGNGKNALLDSLRELELMGLKSNSKSIPYIYKYNTIEIRLSILQGLMDTDGFCGKDKECTKGCTHVFYTTSKQLAFDVQFLTESLGGKAVIKDKQTYYTYNNEKKAGLPSFCVYISMQPNMVPFRLKRKLDRYKPRTKYLPTRFIDKIEYIGKKEAQCISVDSADHLYVTNNFIVTHNTLIAMACGLESVISLKHYDKLIIYRPIQPVGTDMGYLPGDLCDKLEPWMAAIKDSVDFLSEKSNDKNGRRSNGGNNWRNNLAQFSDIIHMEALTYIRGRSISNAFILIDECQNISKDEIKTILTRAGHGTKIVLTGDIEQIDTYHLDALNNGLTYVIEQFKDIDLAGHITLSQGERSPLATLSAKIL